MRTLNIFKVRNDSKIGFEVLLLLLILNIDYYAD